jgi:hypothetical protein
VDENPNFNRDAWLPTFAFLLVILGLVVGLVLRGCGGAS